MIIRKVPVCTGIGDGEKLRILTGNPKVSLLDQAKCLANSAQGRLGCRFDLQKNKK
jgi:hypothetical protein